MLLQAIALYATAILLGAMLFFSFIITPVAFRVLEGEALSRYLQALFPHYYLVIIACGAIAALALASNGQPAVAALLAVVAGLALLMRQALLPKLEALRPARAAGDPAATRQFRRLHGLSMAVNLAQMVAVAVAFWLFAF